MSNEYYDLSMEEIIETIKKVEAKRVLIQLPDGLKPEAASIQEAVKNEFPDVELVFWGGSAFGACDVPLGIDRLGFDLLIHLGHAVWR
jgi:2-(3-amino-3-carboxypropyl)histidine synthase